MPIERSQSVCRRPRRRGALAVELLLVLPILLIVLLGTIQFSLWLTAQQQVTLASREGARAAARGGSSADVELAVHQVLGDARFQAAQVQSALTDANGQPLSAGEPVRVAVVVPMGALVPDLLVFAGLSFRNEPLIGQTVMRKE